MNSKITIEVDFDHGNQPVIQIMFRKSTDVRDNLIQSFLRSFGAVSSWAKIKWIQEYKDGPEPGHFDRVIITPIKPDELKTEGDIMSRQAELQHNVKFNQQST